MRRALLPLLALACTSFANPRPAVDHRLMPRDGQGLALSPTVAQQFVRLMARGIHDQVEPAACVTSWRVWSDTTETGARRVNVDVYALTLAETDSADVLTCGGTRRSAAIRCPPSTAMSGALKRSPTRRAQIR